MGLATVSAPGKAFVVGEYAVAHGGPAVIAALDRRMRCRIQWARGRGRLSVRRPGAGFSGSLADDGIGAVPAELRFAVAAALVSARATGLMQTDIDLQLDSELGDSAEHKVGLGGSAAVTAAVIGAVHAAAEEELETPASRASRVAQGIYSHRLAQGSGSAADVVAATLGGLVYVEHLEASDCPDSVSACLERLTRIRPAAVERLELPHELSLEVVATGRTARSAPRIARFSALVAARDEGSWGSLLAAWSEGMRFAVGEFRAGCATRQASRILAAMRLAGELLERLGAIAAIPIATAELRRARLAACGTRAAVKISGAGGGDCAVAIAPREEAERLRTAWRAAGLTPLSVRVSERGVRREAELETRVGSA